MPIYSSAQINSANDEVPDSEPGPQQDCSRGLREFDEKFHLVVANTDIPLPNAQYRIITSSGEIFEGRTDAEGYTKRVRTKSAATLTIEVLDIPQ